MDASHAINVDPRTSLVTVTLSGFFDEAALRRLSVDREAAYTRLRCKPNQHVTLCDVTGCKLQAQDMITAFQRLLSEPQRRSRKLAFVVGSSLARMQLRRIVADRDYVGTFTDRDTALAWLAEPGSL